jgi:hypothetical protein
LEKLIGVVNMNIFIKLVSFLKRYGVIFLIGLLAYPVQASDITMSGFLSVGGGLVDDKNSVSYGGYSEEDFTLNKNLLGLQITGTVAENITATAQLIAKSADNYKVDSQWAYLTWQATNNTKVRVGRLRTPFYMYSDFLDVGYSYAWISPPREVYYLPFNNVNGIDFYTSTTLGIFDASVQGYFGGFDDELDFNGVPATSKTRNQMGLAATLGKDWWTLRAAYHVADLWVDVSKAPLSATTTMGGFASTLTAFGFSKNAQKLLVEDDSVSFAEIGLNIDTGKFVAAVEHVEFSADDTLLSKNIREYVMGGVRFGDWLIHLTYSKSKDEASHPESGIPSGVALPVVGSSNVLIGTLQAIAASQVAKRNVVTFGTRWDLASSTALKFQFDSVDDTDPTSHKKRDQKVISVALQTVF